MNSFSPVSFNLFLFLFNNLYKVGKFTKIQYTYVLKIARQIGSLQSTIQYYKKI